MIESTGPRLRLLFVSSLLAIACDPGDGGLTLDGDAGQAPAAPDASFADVAITQVLDLPATPHAYAPDLPPHFLTAPVVAMLNAPPDNEITDAGATLGRVLFFDTALSANGTVSCGSCHRGEAAYSDSAVRSTGFEGGLTRRHSMGLVNVGYYARGAMFWDERAASLEEQVLAPIVDETEMGMTLTEVVERLRSTTYYPVLFTLAFGDAEISADRVARALAQFVRAHVSSRARYDDELAAAGGDVMDDFQGFTDEENRGKTLFFAPVNAGGAGCAACHLANPPPGAPNVEPNLAIFAMPGPRNNGLRADTSDDPGVGGVTGLPEDDGLFKSPSLRNVARSAPYMHDGSIASLRAVVEHYNSGIADHPNLDPILRDAGGEPLRLNLSDEDVDALVAFLHTLTDEAFLADERFSDPWRR